MLTRFAPSPTGRLHLGHALAAKEAFSHGPCLLRIEDIDHTRCKTDYTLGIYEDLNWLGFDWPIPVRVQSRHYLDYAKVVAELLERGLAYPCALTRSELKAGARTSPDTSLSPKAYLSHFTHPDGSPNPKPSLPFAVRLNLVAALELMDIQTLTYVETGQGNVLKIVREAIGNHNGPERMKLYAYRTLHDRTLSDRPDPIIARKDIGVSYHIAVTHDDHLQGITHVVRGMDLFEETPLHVLIQKLMGWPTPIYHHHALLTHETGEKLSKRGLDTSLETLRENGLTAAQVLDMANP